MNDNTKEMSLFNNDLNMTGVYRAILVKFNEDTLKSKVYIPSIHSMNPYELSEDEFEEALQILPDAPWMTYYYGGLIQHEDKKACWVIFENGNIKYPVILSYIPTTSIIE